MRTAAMVAACCLAAAISAVAPAQAAKHNWTRFGFNAARTNSSDAVAGIGAADLGKLGRQDIALPGVADSSPIYLHDVGVNGKRRDVFVVGTSYGRVVAIGAASGKILWTYTPPTYAKWVGREHWTTGSPVADPKRGFVYALSPDGHVRKIWLRDGHEYRKQSWPATVTLNPVKEKLSSSLNLANGHVIATTAGHNGDQPPYQGHVALLDRDSGKLEHVFNALCANRHALIDPASCEASDAGIWGRGGAVVIPDTGRILVATGNAPWNGATNWGDSVLELSPDASKLVDSYTPPNESAMDAFDVDLGSASPALIRSGKRWLAAQGGKDGDVRLLDPDNMNGHGGHPCTCKGGELQMVNTPGDISIFAAPASWTQQGTSWLFVTTYESTKGYRLAGNPPRLQRKWANARPGSSPVIAGGLLYVYDPIDGGVTVYRPETGKRIRTLATAKGHWNSPIVADGRIAIPVGVAHPGAVTGTLTIYRKP